MTICSDWNITTMCSDRNTRKLAPMPNVPTGTLEQFPPQFPGDRFILC
jgi:hypothetical protein